MTGEQAIAELGTQARRDQGGSAGDEAVDDDRAASRRRAQHHPGQHADLEAPDLRKYVDRVVRVRVVDRKRPCHDSGLVAQLIGVAPRASPGRDLGRHPGEGGGDGARRRGVPDAHVSGGHQSCSNAGRLLADARALYKTALGLLAAHSRTLGDVRGAGSDPERDQARVLWQRRLHAGVDHRHVHVEPARHRSYRGSSGKEVEDHLRRHVLRVGGYALAYDVMVAGGDDERAARHFGPGVAKDACEPDGYLFETPQAARRLGQARLPDAGAFHHLGVHRGDAADRSSQF